jgi:polyhydroxyalkanoate synthase
MADHSDEADSGRKPGGAAAKRPKKKTTKAAPKKAAKKAKKTAGKSRKSAKAPVREPVDGSRAKPAPDPALPPLETPWSAFGATDADAMESLSRNLVEAALRGQRALSTVLAHAQADPGASRDPFGAGVAMQEAFVSAMGHPDRLISAQGALMEGYMSLWAGAATRMAGGDAPPAITPDPADRRFKAAAWSENPWFDMIKQAYLLNARFMQTFVDAADGLDTRTRRKVQFLTRQMIDAASPSNFPLTNPEVLEETQRTNGENLLRGLAKLCEDLERGGGRLALRQTDPDGFKVGEDLASAPGEVVFHNRLMELIQYAPSTGQVHKTPLLILPPWINKFYILDMREGNSMIRWLTGQGFTVFLVSWVNPDASYASYGFEEYIEEGLVAALDAVEQATGEETVNAVGYCIGGTLLAAALALFAKTGRADRIASATLFAAQVDFEDAGDLMIFTDQPWLEEVEKLMDAQGGVLDGRAMADTFNMLRANDLIWSFYVNNYLLGREPRSFDLLFWNSDQTRMPKALHLAYLNRMYRENALAKGEFELFGQRLNLRDVKIPAYVQATETDHIAPYEGVYRGARLFGGDVRFVLAGSGHIAGVINPPDANKYQHWVNPDLAPTARAWRVKAEERPGSWWPDWAAWLAERSGPMVPARQPGDGALKPLYPAPGQYVKARS